MKNITSFESREAYLSKKADVSFWRPWIAQVLEKHSLSQSLDNIKPGFNSTYPVFVMNDLVVKFFCYRKNWQNVFEKECAVHETLAMDPEILAPCIIAKGFIDEASKILAYKVTTRIAGESWLNTSLTRDQEISLVHQMGTQLKKIHALPTHHSLIEHIDSFSHLDVKAAVRQSVLPEHMTEQVDEFLTTLPDMDKVLVNSDIVQMHVFVHEGCLSGIIDWGDAAITDRHYELGKLCLEFPGDKVLLQTLLDGAQWPMTKSFAKQALGMALYRQAVGLTQHHTFDVFYKVPNVIRNIHSIKTLDELAIRLFQVEPEFQ